MRKMSMTAYCWELEDPHKPQGHRVPEGVAQFHGLRNSPHYLHIPKTPREVPNTMPSV